MSSSRKWVVAVVCAVVLWAAVVEYHYLRRATSPFEAAALKMLASNANKGFAIGGTILAGLSVIIGPLAGLMRAFGGWASARREMGLAGFWMLVMHVLLGLIIPAAGLQKGLGWSWYAKYPWSLGFGIAGFVLLCLIAATSYRWVGRRLGARGWKAVQRLVYLALVMGVCHYMALNKGYLSLWAGWWTTPQRLPSGQIVLRGLPGGTLMLTTILTLFLVIRYVSFMLGRPGCRNDHPGSLDV